MTHERTAQLIPVIIRTCDWQSSSLGVLQAIPRDGRAVAHLWMLNLLKVAPI